MNREKQKHYVLIRCAEQIATLSRCERKKVGCIITDEQGFILSSGYNGTPFGMMNDCEDCNNKTNPFVIHAEMNAILCAARIGRSLLNSVLYTTLAPCDNCAKHIIQAGIKKVFYSGYYENDGIGLLESAGIEVINI